MSKLSQPDLSGISLLFSNELPPPFPNSVPRLAHTNVPNLALPGMRLQIAKQTGVKSNLILVTYAGLGDQVCSEPTLRYAFDHFKDYDLSLATHHPTLFRHLKFKRVFHLLKEPDPPWADYLCYNLAAVDKDLTWDFICGIYTHCVDFASLCAFRMTLPISYKELTLIPLPDEVMKVKNIINSHLKGKEWILVHPGEHWQSKSFWTLWNQTVRKIRKSSKNIVPVLIGAVNADHCGTRSTLDIETEGCLDLRNKLEIMETVALIQQSKVLLTNDSAPLHLAVASNAYIGFVTVAKHPDYLMHYRHGQFGWRMKSFETGGIWNVYNPLSEKSVIDIGELKEKWLPDPSDLANWGIEQVENYTI